MGLKKLKPILEGMYEKLDMNWFLTWLFADVGYNSCDYVIWFILFEHHSI